MSMYGSRNNFLARCLTEKIENKVLDDAEKRLGEIPEAHLSPAARLIRAALVLRSANQAGHEAIGTKELK